jgi:alpha-beta hydrolase superfamily lysophospholipase
MRHQEGFFTDIRGADIYYQCWLPEGEPRAVLLIVHGLAEHSGRYMNVVDHFVPLGPRARQIGWHAGVREEIQRLHRYAQRLR